MADDKDVQEQTIADDSVVKKYKEAGEIVNSWVDRQTFPQKIPRVKATISNRVFINQWTALRSPELRVAQERKIIDRKSWRKLLNFRQISSTKFLSLTSIERNFFSRDVFAKAITLQLIKTRALLLTPMNFALIIKPRYFVCDSPSQMISTKA